MKDFLQLLLFIMAIALPFKNSWAKSDSVRPRDVVLDPAISRRCNDLMEERNSKVKMKQKLVSLINRNEKLLQKIPENKEIIKARLDQTLIQSKQELQLTLLQIDAMEEKIVRKGCPGINL